MRAATRTTTIVLLAAALLCVAAGPRRQVRRAAAPANWDRLVESQFAADAFSLLEGERPADFGDRGNVASEAAVAASASESGAGEGVGGTGDEPPADGDFDRRVMMKKLEGAENSLAEVLSSEKVFRAGLARIDQATDLVIMMGKTLFNGDPEYSDDDTYLKHAEDMANHARQLKNLSRKEDFIGAGAVFGKLKATCNACHEGYR